MCERGALMVHSTQKTASGTAHGKIILTGEHAVVYGMPAIAMPFPQVRAIVTVEKIADEMMLSSEFYHGPLAQIPEKLQGIVACVNATLKVLNRPQKGLRINLNTSIPIGRGLGSSAAIAVAVVKGVFAFYGQRPTKRELMALVRIAETFSHGNPSGIDVAAASADSLIWFQKRKGMKELQIARPIYLIVADTGMIADTHQAVSIVREKYKNYPERTKKVVRSLGAISVQARNALASGNVKYLGMLLNAAQGKLEELGVSNLAINQLVHVARKAGALGAKLTGGGLGGCVLALAINRSQAKAIANHLTKNGAQHTWYVKVTNNKK